MSEACKDSPVSFSTNLNDPSLTYLWDFDDGALNSLPDPIRVFSEEGTYKVSVTITNKYGCSVVETHSIDIQENNMEGKIKINPQTACFGETITLEYEPESNSTLPNIFYWKLNDNLIATTSTGTFVATQSGEYSLDTETSAGCFEERVASVFVEFLDTPTAHISGPNEVCSGAFFSLKSRIKNNDYNYRWTRDSQNLPQFNDQHSISIQETVPGTYTYGLEITAASGCTDTAQFTVNVYPLPAEPIVSFNLISCSPYTVRLTAQANEPGSYIWSDGQSGSSIQVHKGGPYKVIFVNQYGCSSSVEVNVPLNPSAYIWVHPTGCYDTCEQLNANSYLSGPKLPFSDWAWSLDGNPISSGSGLVNNQHFVGNGTYRLYLNDGYCSVESQPMEWTMHPNCENCRLEEVNIESVHPEIDAQGNCFYYISLSINNPYPPLSYNLQNTSGNGIVVPGAGVLPSGQSSLQLEFYPNQALPTSGGIAQLLFIANIDYGEEKFKCIFELLISLPPCTVSSLPPNNDLAELSVAPNPTTGYTSLYYQLPVMDDTSAVYSLSLYDSNGRLLDEKLLDNKTSEWQIDFTGFAEGIYIAVLRKNTLVESYKRIQLKR